MKKILYLTILVMTLMPCVSVYSQLGGLNVSLAESGLTNNSISEAEDETDVEDLSHQYFLLQALYIAYTIHFYLLV